MSTFEQLRDFIKNRMRMSHIYQPVMLKTLLTNGGKATIRDIAAAFLARDQSQLEYYEEITKTMPGKILAKHGLAERDGNAYRLTGDIASLADAERDELVRLCDEAVHRYIEKRGSATYDHRRAALEGRSGAHNPGSGCDFRQAGPRARQPLRAHGAHALSPSCACIPLTLGNRRSDRSIGAPKVPPRGRSSRRPSCPQASLPPP